MRSLSTKQTGKTGETPRAVYARPATTDSRCETQLRELRAYVERRGWVIAGEYVDTGCSGKGSVRPQLGKLMNDARGRQFDCVLVWTLDRWGRSLTGCLDLIEQLNKGGIVWSSVSQGIEIGKDSPWLMFISALRLFGSESKREHVKAGMLVAKRRRWQTIGRPKLIFDRELVKRLSEEGKSSREIAVKMGIGRGTVQRILAGPKG
jgi:DNA invertase Pin-like site-specific DNA recombinase